MPVNFMSFILADTLVAQAQKDKGVEDKDTRRQLALFAGLFSPEDGLSSAVVPALLVRQLASIKADEKLRTLQNSADLVEYIDANAVPRGQAKQNLESRGFRVEEVGAGATLTRQTPPFQTGLFLKRGTSVTLEYSGGT